MNDLSIRHVSKRYPKKGYALADFSCELTNGVYGLLGPNGAGKSTLMRILTTNQKKTSGTILYNETEIEKLGKEYKKHIGYMPQSQTVYPGFTLERFLYYMAALKGMKRAEARKEIPVLISLVNLSEHSKQKLGEYSGGMRQRAMLAAALLGQPDILILDEPTAGLDPKERIRIRNIISQTAMQKIVLIATHVVQDLEMIAENILLLKDGELIDMENTDTLCSKAEGKVFEITCSREELQQIEDQHLIGNISKRADSFHVRVLSDKVPAQYVYQQAEPDLEDVYLYILGEETGESK